MLPIYLSKGTQATSFECLTGLGQYVVLPHMPTGTMPIGESIDLELDVEVL